MPEPRSRERAGSKWSRALSSSIYGREVGGQVPGVLSLPDGGSHRPPGRGNHVSPGEIDHRSDRAPTEAATRAPRVSVLMTIYNAGPYLNESIDSLITQSFGDWELI